ncbi:acyltransferase family protein [Vibrio cyclitrophicus]
MNSRIEQLTGLRFFAALLVFVSHIKWSDSLDIYQKIFKEGYVGVSFFFILSGFVLSLSYKEKIATGLISLKRYFFLRFARLTPLHFATCLPFVIFSLYKGDLNVVKLLLNISYLQSFIPHSEVYFSFNAPSWSLSNEMFFYICFFPLAMVTLRNLLVKTTFLFFVVVLSALVVTMTLKEDVLLGGASFAHWLFYIFPGFRVLEFLVGMILYEVWKRGVRLKVIFIPISYLVLLVSMYFASEVPEAYRMSLYYLPASVLLLFSHLTDDGIVNRFYSTKLMVLLGNASFAFYLIHQPLLGVFSKLMSSLELSNFSFFVIALCGISFLSVMVYELYEKRAERALKSLSNRID